MTTSEIIAVISVLLALAATLLTLWQNFLTRRAVEAQVFLTVEQLAKEAHYLDGIIVIASLKNYENFEEFTTSESKETQVIIYDTANFLNFLAHLVEKKFLNRQTAWDVYFWGYRICGEKLLTWWLQGQRQKHPHRLATFERMCRRIGSISNETIAKFDMERSAKI